MFPNGHLTLFFSLGNCVEDNERASDDLLKNEDQDTEMT